jgi:hypothetical protein
LKDDVIRFFSAFLDSSCNQNVHSTIFNTYDVWSVSFVGSEERRDRKTFA